jgi:hypothetical protein
MKRSIQSFSDTAFNIEGLQPIGWMYDALPGDIILRPKPNTDNGNE